MAHARRAQLYHDLAEVAARDADALENRYAWPPKVLTDEERAEVERLRDVGDALYERAVELEGSKT